MIQKTALKAVLLFLVFPLLFSACKEDEKKLAYNPADGSYFSLRQFAQDQWHTYMGEPFSIIKTVRVNEGKYDTSYTTSDTLNWGAIFDQFFETEISDPEFLGKYKFTHFPDNEDDTYNYFYEALDDDLYTRKLLITISQETRLAHGIYVEAMRKSLFEDKVIKLYYKPMKRIQIQITETPLFGEKTHTVTEYEFIR